MNASIRENARNRNTRQNANVFNSPRPQVGREERTAGLMGGGTPRVTDRTTAGNGGTENYVSAWLLEKCVTRQDV